MFKTTVVPTKQRAMTLLERTFPTDVELVEYAEAMTLKFLWRHPCATIEELEGIVDFGADTAQIVGLSALRLLKNGRISLIHENGAFERVPPLQSALF